MSSPDLHERTLSAMEGRSVIRNAALSSKRCRRKAPGKKKATKKAARFKLARGLATAFAAAILSQRTAYQVQVI
jgi:hypothetical protein